MSGAINQVISDSVIVFVSEGVHKVDLYWGIITAGTASATGTSRTLTVREL
jgi:hypothetical protein